MRTYRTEAEYQAHIIDTCKELFPGATVKKLTAPPQGIPDVWILHTNGKSAFLECKRSADEPHQPNQDYYVEKYSRETAFASFIFPENEQEVLNGLQQALGPGR